MEPLIHQLKTYTPVSEALKSALQTAFSEKTVTKGTEIIREGQYCRHFYFIEKGLFRSYFLHEGKERTYWFHAEDQFFTAWYSFYLTRPSFETVEAVEPSTVYAISKTDFDALADTHREFGRFARLFIQNHYAMMDYATKIFQDLSAKEKYAMLLESMPSIDQRARLGDIASFLGMSQETLSRLRGKK